MGKYALIKDGVLVNVILADDTFLEVIRPDYDAIVDYEEHPQNPSPGAQAVEQVDGWVFVDQVPEVVEPAPVIEDPVSDAEQVSDAEPVPADEQTEEPA